MTAASTAPPSFPASSPWAQALQARGFEPVKPHRRTYARDTLRYREEPRWLVWDLTGEASSDPAFGRLGNPGLWARIDSAGRAYGSMEVPRPALVGVAPEDGDTNGPEQERLEAILDWVLATARGEPPRGWQAPTRDLVESWMEPSALTIRRGPWVRQGELILTASRWAIRCPVVPSFPAKLPPERDHHLRALIRESQNTWRMVRMGLRATTEPHPHHAWLVEVDFTGAPPGETLFLAGLEALQHAVRALAETADLLTDPSVTIRSLAIRRPANTNQKEKA